MKWAAIWLSVLTVLYVVNLIGDFLQAKRFAELKRRVAELEGKASAEGMGANRNG